MTGQTEGAAPLGHNDGDDGRAVAGCQRLVGSMYQGIAAAGDAGIVWCTPGLEDLLTYGTGELIGHPMTDLFPDGASYQRFRTELEWCLQSKGYLQSSVTLKGKDGVLVDADVAVASGPASMSGAAELIIAARRSQRCEERRRTEPVASLCSRSAFESRLREEVENALRGKRPLSLLFLDIDGFERRKRVGLHDSASPVRALAEPRS